LLCDGLLEARTLGQTEKGEAEHQQMGWKNTQSRYTYNLHNIHFTSQLMLLRSLIKILKNYIMRFDVTFASALKGTVSQDFLLRVFFKNHFPTSP